MEADKKKLALNIVSSKVNHKGFGAGAIDLSNVSGVIIDGEEAYLDEGTLHAKSKIEKGIKFSMNKEEVPNGRKAWIVWVAVDRAEDGAYYAGMSACEMLIDTEARRGWKILADHVNKMDAAMKRKFVLEGLSDKEREALRTCLIAHNEDWWNRSDQTLKDALS
ncbi:YwhD family protein [Paenibacillus roseipurpureus]|uniref:YwhD family protein n=1 Tax=Paenibacillus roseopurpureus TaxID=2918901 RepID=A0AA96LPP6_9BACL|nr:YwhD family protein [Paenibacillus sp. MBLB1832]WNR44336.1 YwhD family protein [Paenibacillus sp. MBLB1832]